MQPSPDQASENPPDQPEVILDRHGEIAVIRLNRPARLNAATYENLMDIITALDNCDADDDVSEPTSRPLTPHTWSSPSRGAPARPG